MLKTPYSESFKELFSGPKSYANRVYNQQFKGTLKILRRLFSINLESKNSQKNESILKYDQPLYKEELNDQNPNLHEELKNSIYVSKNKIISPFLKEVTPIPFYAGWDEVLRKFLVTNYWLAYSDTGVKVDYSNVFKLQNFNTKLDNKKLNTIHFITWPLSKDKIEQLKSNDQISANLMFSSYDDPANEQQRDIFEYAETDDIDVRLIYDTLPSILKRVDLRDKDKEHVYVKPLRGGILWKGSEAPKFKLKEFIDIIIKFTRDWRDSNP